MNLIYYLMLSVLFVAIWAVKRIFFHGNGTKIHNLVTEENFIENTEIEKSNESVCSESLNGNSQKSNNTNDMCETNNEQENNMLNEDDQLLEDIDIDNLTNFNIMNDSSDDFQFMTENDSNLMYGEISDTKSFEKGDKDYINIKNATVCSGYGSTEDETQGNLTNIIDESQDISTSQTIDNSCQSDFEESSCEANNFSFKLLDDTSDDINPIEDKKNQIRTYFTDRKCKYIKHNKTEKSNVLSYTKAIENKDLINVLEKIKNDHDLENNKEYHEINDDKSFYIDSSDDKTELNSDVDSNYNEKPHIVSDLLNTEITFEESKEIFDSDSFTSSGFTDSLPSTIHSNNSFNDIQCVEDYIDVSFFNSTTSENMNEAFIELEE